MPLTKPIEILEPSVAEVETARKISEALEALNRQVPRRPTTDAVQMPALGEMSLPRSAVRMFFAIVAELAAGHSIALHRVDDHELTTSEAAELLGMSRPTLIDILERGEIPYRMVGTHRRLRQRDVLAYRSETERGGTGANRRPRGERLRGLEEMAEYTEELGLGY